VSPARSPRKQRRVASEGGWRILRRAAKGGQGCWRTAIALAALTWVALAVCGCETNAQRSASLEKAALAQRRLHPLMAQKGVAVNRENPQVQIVSAVAVHSENGTAAVVTLRNVSRRPLRDAPIAITVLGKHGATLYRNDAAGLQSALVTVALLRPQAQTVWVDDQVQAAEAPAKVSALVGEATAASGKLPALSVSGLHTSEEVGSEVVEGSVRNSSAVAQQQLVVYVVGRRSGHVVTAGRAVLPEVGAGQRLSFQVFPIGSARGAQLEASAPPTTTTVAG
jgi:hypothetical protein